MSFSSNSYESIDFRETDTDNAEQWTTVIDNKKQKDSIRKENKEINNSTNSTNKSSNLWSEAFDEKEEVVQTTISKDYDFKNDKKDKKPKKKVEPTYTPNIYTEAGVIDALTQIILSSPGHSVSLSAMSLKFQELTKHNWNKKCKPTYGSLSDFVESRGFIIEGGNVKIGEKVVENKKSKSSFSGESSNNSQSKKVEKKVETKVEQKSDKKKQDQPKNKNNSNLKNNNGESSASATDIMSVVFLMLAAMVGLAAFSSPEFRKDLQTTYKSIIDSVFDRTK